MGTECFGCGCTESKACTSTDKSCHWLVIDNVLGLGVCSSCHEYVERFEQHQKEMTNLALSNVDDDELEKDYRNLIEGEALEIGDEYQTNTGWQVLSVSEFAEWVTAYSHYWPSKGMSSFRRDINKDPELTMQSENILSKAVNSLNELPGN